MFHLRPQLSAEEAKLRKVEAEEQQQGAEEEPDEAEEESSEADSDLEPAEELDEVPAGEEGHSPAEEDTEGGRRKKQKSVVSQLHEAAFRLKMNVEFEVLTESGVPHNRQYTLCCRLSSPRHSQALEVEGCGTSKKAAKQNACRQMLEQVQGLGECGPTPETMTCSQRTTPSTWRR